MPTYLFCVLLISTLLCDAYLIAGPLPPGRALKPRAPCSYTCPIVDLGFFPISPSSGVSGGSLVCYYPFLSYCTYDVTNGTLSSDSDQDLCPLNAQCSDNSCTCPTSDLGSYALGPGSGPRDSNLLMCTYPTTTQLARTNDYCDYSLTDGTLSQDNDSSLCPAIATASCADTTTAVTTIIPTFSTTISSIFTTTSSTPPSIPSVASQLLSCRPCGSNKCSFNADSAMPDENYRLAVGKPVFNCGGSNSSITSTIGGSITIQDTWSVDTTIGLNLGPLQIQSGSSWSRSIAKTWTQEIGITIAPSEMGVLVAIIKFNRTQGSMKIGSRETFPLISNQPFDLVGYESEIIPCTSQFTANMSSPFNCTSTSNAPGPPITNFALMMVVIPLSIILFM